MNGDETMKNALREAMLGPSVLLLALSAISTGSSCQAAPAGQSPKNQGTAPIVLDTPATPPTAPAPANNAPTTVETDAPAAPNEASPFMVQAKAVQTAPKAGEVLDLVIEVKNTSDTLQTLRFTSGKRFDFQAFKPGETEPIWTWSAGRMFTQMLRDQLIEPGATATFKAKWPAPPQGKFSIRAKITANGGLEAAPFTIEVA
jgi:hypothetical protein